MSKFEIEDLSNRAYKAIRGLILSNDLKPGDRLHQEDLAKRFGISRTPILQAISKLEKEMLIETITHKGSFVRKFDNMELLQIYDVRLRLEPLGAGEAARNVDATDISEIKSLLEDFDKKVQENDHDRISGTDYALHARIIVASRNKILRDIVSMFSLIMVSNNRGLLKDPHDSLEDHRRIVDAISRRDVPAAEEAMYNHIASARKNLERMDH